MDNPAAGERCIDHEVGRGADADDERTCWFYFYDLPVAFELPTCHGAAGEAAAKARVVEQVTWMSGAAATIEVSG